MQEKQQQTNSFYGPFSRTIWVIRHQNSQLFCIFIIPRDTAHPCTLCLSCPQIHWLTCQQTVLQINSHSLPPPEILCWMPFTLQLSIIHYDRYTENYRQMLLCSVWKLWFSRTMVTVEGLPRAAT